MALLSYPSHFSSNFIAARPRLQLNTNIGLHTHHDLRWMTPSKEDYLRWNTTFDGRQPFFRTQNLFETNQTYQTSNLPDQTYQTKPNNQIYQTKPTKPSLLNQTQQALPTNQTYLSNLTHQSYQIRFQANSNKFSALYSNIFA